MQGLVFSSVYVRERESLIWTARPFYHFLFLENANLKKYSFSKNTFIKGKLLFFSLLPPAPHFAPEGRHACLLEEGSRWGRWGWSWELEMLPQACVMMVRSPDLMHWIHWRGQPNVSVLSDLVPSPSPLELPKWAGSALLSKRVFQNSFLLVSRVYHYKKAW